MYPAILIGLFLLIPSLLRGQQNNLYPDQFGAYFLNLSLVNPSIVPAHNRFDALAQTKWRTGQFSKITTIAFTAGKTFQTKNNRWHLLRLLFMDEKEGPYISRPRAYANYALGVPMMEDVFLYAGAAAGFSQVNYSAPSASATGNATMPDASLGLSVKIRQTLIGFSGQQIVNGRSRPLYGAILLHRYFNFLLKSSYRISQDINLKGSFLLQLFPSKQYVNPSLLVSYRDLLSFGASYGCRGGISGYLSFNLQNKNYNLLLSFMYNSSFPGPYGPLGNSYETAAGYNFRE